MGGKKHDVDHTSPSKMRGKSMVLLYTKGHMVFYYVWIR
nr:MAG TPA: hypothetical protein [Bacteriophage sp.]